MKNCWKHINLPGWETAQDELYKYVTEVEKKYAYNMDLEVVRNCYPYPHDDMLEHVPTLVDVLNPIGEIKSVSLVCLFKHVMTIHTDKYTDMEGNANSKWKLNIPVMNVSDKTITCWYERTNPRDTSNEEFPFGFYQSAGFLAANKKTASDAMKLAQNQIFAPEEMTKIDEVVLDRPIIFDSHTPHNVIIEGWKFPRITASIYFKDDKALDAYL
tara:strand:+ start:587 stop:1228 length:642 start_codon:yes stop_codon:yes gene_type:complete